ncbi:hypothetical protein [Sinorhizobium meliloti]|uniref:hypothetical protein n=1 Tax=Rhizobium meliloti TaxID=382 RepID=UPI0012965C48|nr:hypothetical protein [Sinorhizobium meliloti]MQX90292.1 hypothetical protein [Sinorhizobium meliloti]
MTMNDHARGCEGREYTCTCGYDDARDAVMERLAKALEPFARIAEIFDNKPPQGADNILHAWETTRGSCEVTMTACAEARAALAAKAPTE